jgi:hypothetical protein
MKGLIILLIITLSGCGKKDCCVPCCLGPSRLESVAGTWKVTYVDQEKVTRTAEWTNFTLTFMMDKTYVTENSADYEIWPQTGTFKFAGTTGAGLDVIIRDDDQTINIDNITLKDLHLSMELRAKEQWVFQLKK